jgi:hypothetical protein
MEHNKALGPDDFPVEFYQAFLELIKGDLMAFFMSFTKVLYHTSTSILVLSH